MTRHPHSLHGVPRDRFPRFTGTIRVLRLPEPIPPRFVSFAWQYRGCARGFAPTGCGRPLAVGLDFLVTRGPAGIRPRSLRGFPGSWVDPIVCMPWADTPEDPRRQAFTASRMLPSAHPTTSAPRTCSLSRLITTAYTLAVYASQLGLPRLHHARLASGGWPPLPGRIRTYWVHDEGFQALSIAYPFLPSQAWPGARGVSTVGGKGPR